MFYDPISRRHFLRGAGGFLLALPILPSLLARNAMAAATDKFFVFITSQDGAILPANLFPSTDASTPFSLYPGHTIYHSTLSSLAGAQGLSPTLGPSLTPHLPKMNLLRGLDWRSYLGHCYGATNCLGNIGSMEGGAYPQAPNIGTIDQVIAHASSFYATAPKQRSMIINPRQNQYNICSSQGWADPFNRTGQVSFLPPDSDPNALFAKIFNGVQSGAGNTDSTIVDAVYNDYQTLKGNSRLGSQDKATLDHHLQSLQELNQKLNQTVACTVPGAPPSIPTIAGQSVATVEQSYALFNSVVAAAIRCGLSRVATIHVSSAYNFPDEFGTNGSHTLSHDAENPASQAQIVANNKWIIDRVYADLLNKLNVSNGLGGTYLDSGLVCYSSENSLRHCNRDMMILAAGSANGWLNTNRYIDYRNRSGQNLGTEQFYDFYNGTPITVKPGLLISRFFVTALQAMGLAPAEYAVPGVSGYGYSGQYETYNTGVGNAYNLDLPNVNVPLPLWKV